MKKERLTIAVTGGIGSGKSTAMRLIEKYGFTTLSCDEIYKEISEGEEYLRQIKSLFPDAITKEGALDRKQLAKIVFNDKKQLERLNGLSHPLILKELKTRAQAKKGLVFCEIPLLFESREQDGFDYVLIVKRSLTARLAAICQRDKTSESDAMKRISNQFDYDSLKNLPDNYFLLENDGSETQLGEQLESVIATLSLQLKN